MSSVVPHSVMSQHPSATNIYEQPLTWEVETKTTNIKIKIKNWEETDTAQEKQSFNNDINKKLSSIPSERHEHTPGQEQECCQKGTFGGQKKKELLNSKMKITAEPINSIEENKVEKISQKAKEKRERGRKNRRVTIEKIQQPTNRCYGCIRGNNLRQPPALQSLGFQIEEAQEISSIENRKGPTPWHIIVSLWYT